MNYSDTTPDVTYAYNRLGKQSQITDAVGTRTFGYNDDLQLETEEIMGLYIYDGWTLDTPVNANAFSQESAGAARPASQGWNVVMTLDGVGEKNRVFTWGLDLSGQAGNPSSSPLTKGGTGGWAGGIHGAGGIGGLLAMTTCSVNVNEEASYLYLYDGNGNVGQVLATIRDENWDITGVQTNLAARYEYGAEKVSG